MQFWCISVLWTIVTNSGVLLLQSVSTCSINKCFSEAAQPAWQAEKNKGMLKHSMGNPGERAKSRALRLELDIACPVSSSPSRHVKTVVTTLTVEINIIVAWQAARCRVMRGR